MRIEQCVFAIIRTKFDKPNVWASETTKEQRSKADSNSTIGWVSAEGTPLAVQLYPRCCDSSRTGGSKGRSRASSGFFFC